MKKVILLSALSLIAFASFAQSKKVDSTKGHGETAIGKFHAPTGPTFVLVFSQAEIAELYNFIKNADMWSEKGRLAYLEALDKKVSLLPGAADTAQKK